MAIPRYWAMIPAAGAGRRMAATMPKQYLPLVGRPVMVHALMALLEHPLIAGAVVAISADDEHWLETAATFTPTKPLRIVAGGVERAYSVLNGLAALREWAAPEDWVLVHDAARPCLRRDDVDRLLTALADDPVGGLLAVPVRDTLKQADAAGRVATTVDRSSLWHALTPQMFRLGVLHDALHTALVRGSSITDEAAAIEAAGFAPRLIEGRADNLKITRPEDLALAEFYLTHRHSNPSPPAGERQSDTHFR